MRGMLRDGALLFFCVLVPCAVGLSLDSPKPWTLAHRLGGGLFVVSTMMVFLGFRLLLTPRPRPYPTGRVDDPRDLLCCPALSDRSRPARSVTEALLGPAAEGSPSLGPSFEPPGEPPDRTARPRASSEIIHVERGSGSARVVALLHTGLGVDDVHLLELDVSGSDLRPEVLAEAVEGVASGEPTGLGGPVDKVGYASGWGLTLPCPPHRQ